MATYGVEAIASKIQDSGYSRDTSLGVILFVAIRHPEKIKVKLLFFIGGKND